MLFPQEMKLHLHLGGLGTHLLCAHPRNVVLAAPPPAVVLSSCDSFTSNGNDCWGRGGQKLEKAPAVEGSRGTSEMEFQSPWDLEAGGQDETQQQGEMQNCGRHLETEESSGMGSSSGETREFTCGFLQLSLSPS